MRMLFAESCNKYEIKSKHKHKWRWTEPEIISLIIELTVFSFIVDEKLIKFSLVLARHFDDSKPASESKPWTGEYNTKSTIRGNTGETWWSIFDSGLCMPLPSILVHVQRNFKVIYIYIYDIFIFCRFLLKRNPVLLYLMMLVLGENGHICAYHIRS